MNIKGKTIIELSDAKTGKLVKRTEDNNMLTNALSLFYKQGGMTNPTAFNADALRSDALHYLLGGILCLDTAISEDATIVRVPAGVGMTANGAYNVLNTGNPPELGSWNENESGWQQDGSFKMVWDFTTSQGNGTVACVCLSSWYAGMQGIGNKSLTNKANPVSNGAYNSVRTKGIDPTQYNQVIGYYGNKIYVINNNPNAFGNKTSIDVMVYKFPYSEVDVRNIQGAELIETKTVELPSAVQNIQMTRTYAGATCQKGNLTYMMLVSESNADNVSYSSTGYVLIWNNQTETFANAYVVNPSGIEDYHNIVGITPTRAILGNYSIDYTNLADVETLTDGLNIAEHTYHPTTKHVLKATQDGTLYSNTGYYFDLSSKVILPVNGAYSLSNFVFNDLMGFEGSAIYRDPRYIATINNLTTPVVKTADKTMKVTYVLRFS